MPRGGKRPGAGRKSSWPSGCGREDTKLIRVPIAIAEDLLEIARRMDGGERVSFISSESKGDVQAGAKLTPSDSQILPLFGFEAEHQQEDGIDFSDADEPLTLREAAKLVGCAPATLQNWKSKLSLSELASKTLSKSGNTVALTFRAGKYYANRLGNTI